MTDTGNRWPAKGPARIEVANPAGLTGLEIAISRMLGTERRDPLPRPDRHRSLDDTLHDILEPALASGRCLVSFSGGRESSWLLAAAVDGARRHGHPDPIPVTVRHAGDGRGGEATQQERVVTYLGLEEWERIVVHDELEILGPYAQRALASVGLLFPATAYAFLPLLDLARGGWVVSGGVMTDFFTYWHWARLSDVLARRRRPRRRDARDLAVAVLPRRGREAALRRRLPKSPPWLRAGAARDIECLVLGPLSDVPVSFAAAMERQRTHRCYIGMRASLDALATSVGARLLMPFRDDRFIAAIAAAGGRYGFGDRTSGVQSVAGHLLPPDLLRRSDGTDRRHTFFGESSRVFARRWTGAGLDSAVVDVDVLGTLWASGEFPPSSTMLFQVAFAHDEARSAARV